MTSPQRDTRVTHRPLVRMGAMALLQAVAAIAMIIVLSFALDGRYIEPWSPAGLVRSVGLAALLWSYLGLLCGLVIGTGSLRAGSDRDRRARRRSFDTLAETAHRHLSVAALALVLLHVLVFVVLAPGGSWWTLVPGAPDPQSFGFGLGAVGLYLALILGPTFYFRDRIGRRTWLVAHQLAALTYALSLWHSVGLGPELRPGGGWSTVVWIAQLPLLALIALKLWRPKRLTDELSTRSPQGRRALARPTTLRIVSTVALISTGIVVLALAVQAGG